MAKIGATSEGGVERLALSMEDKLARDLFVKWLKDLNLEVRIDDMGNIFGNRPGGKNNLSCIMSGSHLDSQPKGGRLDGTLGMMGALEVLRTLDEAKIVTHRPITIVNWTNEEGTRFAPGLLGSGVWTGKFEKDWAYERVDAYGKKLRPALEMIGYKGNLSTGEWSVHAYYELHIEQGPILEGQAKIIGSPLGVVCRHHYDVEVEGTANQVGPTPMAATWWLLWGESRIFPIRAM
jgi:N-carbamoyl-L-amino-acid hydrolase